MIAAADPVFVVHRINNLSKQLAKVLLAMQ